jgi:hypothetical protein
MSIAMRNQIQETFAALHVSQAQNDDWMHKLFDHEAFATHKIVEQESFAVTLPTKCNSQRLDKMSSKDDEAASAILDTWYTYIAYEVERTRIGNEPTPTPYSEDVFEPSKRVSNTGPPRRFCRRGSMKTTTGHVPERADQYATENGSF